MSKLSFFSTIALVFLVYLPGSVLSAQVSVADQVEERLIGADATDLGLLEPSTNVLQTGQDNQIQIQQVDLQLIQVQQTGLENNINLEVAGQDNVTLLSQTGIANDMDIRYSGEENDIRFSQNGYNNQADVDLGEINGQQLHVEQRNDNNVIEHDADIDGTLTIPMTIIQSGESRLRIDGNGNF